MKKQIIIASQRLKVIWDNPKEWVRRKMQESIQSLLEEGTAELLGRRESERWRVISGSPAYRNDYGKE